VPLDSIEPVKDQRGDVVTPACPKVVRPKRTFFPGPRSLLAIAAVLLISLSASPVGGQQLRLSLVHLPSPYTELFFVDATGLPLEMTPDSTELVLFVIRNHEGKAINYSYVTRVDGPGGLATREDRVTIASGSEATEIVQEGVTRPGEYIVTISLIGKPQTLQFRTRVQA
jgi:hypothetical protein